MGALTLVSATSARVYACDAGFLKIHRSDRGFTQEAAALRMLAETRKVPEILREWPEHHALLLGSVEGEVPVGVPQELPAFLGELRRFPVPHDEVPLGEALVRRVRAAQGRLSEEDAAWVAPLVRAVEGHDFSGSRVWCHRDLRPENVRVGSGLVVLDWEHARPDHPATDALKWPGLLPYLEGNDDFEALSALFAVATLAWGVSQADRVVEEEGRELVGARL